MKTTAIKSPVLKNAAAIAKQNPGTFSVPNAADLAAVKPGSLVKVAVNVGHAAERFWVEVTEIRGDVIIGRIDNDLVGTEEHGMDYNDLIQFSRDNIYSITPPHAPETL